MTLKVCFEIYICIIIRDNLTYEGFRVLDIYKKYTNIKRSCDTLIQYRFIIVLLY